MTTFKTRLATALPHEAAVLARLREAGWTAGPYGQGQLKEVRDELRHLDTPLRWAPDIIAIRTYPTGHKRLVFVDAKAGSRWRTTGNHGVEMAALKAADEHERAFGGNVFFVFSDFGVAHSERIWSCWKPGPRYGNGSDTPYVIFKREICVPFEAQFGQPIDSEADPNRVRSSGPNRVLRTNVLTNGDGSTSR